MDKKHLNFKETLMITSMLFGLFFGAGNLIFPIYMGTLAGRNIISALAGFLVTGVGLPILGVAALGISRSNGLLELSGKVGKGYARFFTCLLYLTIGPFFAIPRCTTVPYEVGALRLLGDRASNFSLLIFSLVFFLIVLWFSLRPNGILTWIGKILNPIFLAVLSVLIITALLFPGASIKDIPPAPSYTSEAFFTGFLEGYNTMDALAGLAFGIIVVTVIRDLGIERPEYIAKNTVFSGIFSGLLMAVIYIAVALVGTQCMGYFSDRQFANGGEVFAAVAEHYFGGFGAIILAAIVTVACLKTAIGLITSCSETFEEVFRGKVKYKVWVILFCSVSFIIANIGLTNIIEYSLPVLMFLYPQAISLILLALTGKFFNHSKTVYISVTVFTLAAAVLDLIKALPKGITSALRLDTVITAANAFLPFYRLGLGWICPLIAGAFIGIIIMTVKNLRRSSYEN